MNPLVSYSKCVWRCATALVLGGSLVLALGCGNFFGNGGGGGGGGGTGGSGNFSKASLKGQYLIALTGIAFDQLPLTGTDPFSEMIVLTADGKRKDWKVSGPHFAGWEVYHLKGSPADPARLGISFIRRPSTLHLGFCHFDGCALPLHVLDQLFGACVGVAAV